MENAPQTPQTSSSKRDSPSPFPFPIPRPPPVKACTSLIEESLAADGPVVGNADHPVPTISNVAPPAARLTASPPLPPPPERVTPTAAVTSVFPSTMTMEEDSALTSNPLISISDDGNVGGGVLVVIKSGIVREPMSRIPGGWRLMIVPSTVAAGPPTETVVPAMAKTEGYFLASSCVEFVRSG